MQPILDVVIIFIEPAPTTDHPVQSYLMIWWQGLPLIPLDLYLSLIKDREAWILLANLSVTYTYPSWKMVITLAGISVTYTCPTCTHGIWYLYLSHVYTWYRLLILVPRVHVVYLSSLSQLVNYRNLVVAQSAAVLNPVAVRQFSPWELPSAPPSLLLLELSSRIRHPTPDTNCTVSSEFGDPQPAASSQNNRDYSTQQRF